MPVPTLPMPGRDLACARVRRCPCAGMTLPMPEHDLACARARPCLRPSTTSPVRGHGSPLTPHDVARAGACSRSGSAKPCLRVGMPSGSLMTHVTGVGNPSSSQGQAPALARARSYPRMGAALPARGEVVTWVGRASHQQWATRKGGRHVMGEPSDRVTKKVSVRFAAASDRQGEGDGTQTRFFVSSVLLDRVRNFSLHPSTPSQEGP